MRHTGISARVAAIALGGMVLLSGCGKGKQQPASETSAAQSTAQSAPQSPAQSTPQSTPQSTAQNPAPAPNGNTPAAAPPPPAMVTIPARTPIRVRLDEAVGSKISVAGQAFSATVANDVVVNGQTVIPRGAHAVGTVVDAKPLGRIKGGALLELRLDRIRTDSGSYPVATSTMERIEKGKGKRTAKFAGGGGAFGAIVGGLAGGGKGALIGGLVGAGAGTAGSAMSGNREIVLPAETLITFRLEHPVQITQ